MLEEQPNVKPGQDAIQASEESHSLAHIWSDKGLAADQKKIKVVKKMEIPQDIQDDVEFPRGDQLPQPVQPCI